VQFWQVRGEADLCEPGSDPRSQIGRTLILLLYGITKNEPNFLFHAVPVGCSAAFKAGLHVSLQAANDKLSHVEPTLGNDIKISSRTMGG
jgi:hypothetical protein